MIVVGSLVSTAAAKSRIVRATQTQPIADTNIRRRDHPAEEVYATGTFDNWSKSLKLDKTVNNTFEKTLALPHTGEKIFYKVRAVT